MTMTGHAAPATFVLRGVIAHQGAELMVEGEAVWVVDDGECPKAVKEIPGVIQEGTVMVWASNAELSDFWSRTIGTIEPPPKRPRILQDEVNIFYGNVAQWTKEVFQWLIQQDLQIVMMVETHLAGNKMEGVMSELCRSRWFPTFLEAHETGRGGTSGGQAFCCREGQTAYKLHQYGHEGNGFLANVVQRQKWELCVISVYLKVWGGSELSGQCQGVGAGGCPGSRAGHPVDAHWGFSSAAYPKGPNLLNVLRVEIVSSGQPTMINGAEIDYIVASRVIAPFLEIKVNWDVPWKPHAGLMVHVAQEAPKLALQQLTGDGENMGPI